MSSIDYMDDYMEYELDELLADPEDARMCDFCESILLPDKFTNRMEHQGVCDHCFDKMKHSLKKFLSGEASEMDPTDKTIAGLYITVLEDE